MNYPSPEDIHIAQEELAQMVDEAHNKINLLINLTFHRKELFDAWYARNVLSATITAIASAQHLSWSGAKKRIKTANEIVLSLRSQLHKIDD